MVIIKVLTIVTIFKIITTTSIIITTIMIIIIIIITDRYSKSTRSSYRYVFISFIYVFL